MCSQSGCIVWFENVSLVNVLQRFLIICHQQPFDISMYFQNECIVWFKNIILVKVLQGSLITIQHLFDLSMYILKVNAILAQKH